MASRLRLGTRGSALALWQAEHVSSLLADRGHTVEIHKITTTGDRVLDRRLESIGGDDGGGRRNHRPGPDSDPEGVRPEARYLCLAVVVAREQVLAGDVPDDGVGEQFHQRGRVGALLCFVKAADEFFIRVHNGRHYTPPGSGRGSHSGFLSG